MRQLEIHRSAPFELRRHLAIIVRPITERVELGVCIIAVGPAKRFPPEHKPE